MEALLKLSNQNHNAIEFQNIKESDYLPALKKSISEADQAIKDYKSNTQINFKSVIEDLDSISEDVDYISSIFYSMYSAHATDELREKSQEFSATLTEFSNKISLDEEIFEKIKALYLDKDNQGLTLEQDKVIEKYYSDLVRNGALLKGEKKDRLKEINKKLSELSLKFSDNVLQSSNSLTCEITNLSELEGVPEHVINQASKKAKELNKEGYVLTMDYPVVLPVLKYCKNRETRKKLNIVFKQRGRVEGFNNKEIIKEEISLRNERSQLLGFRSHVDFTLKKRMAQNEETVLNFIEEVISKAMGPAKKEFEQLENLALEDGIKDYSPWDHNYYSEILKQKVLSFNDEVLRPYFSVEKCLSGMFEVANKLYDLNFKLRDDLPKYHEEVMIYEVFEKDQYLGLFYVDLYPRATKKQGAWMTNLFDQGLFKGKVHRPHVAIVCNFTKPTESKPSLLTFNEVLTLYHEFGHALHGLLSKCTYRAVSGTSVYWDFVELPSQIMENWVKEKECLDLFARHFETGENIPEDIIKKIKQSNQFLEGLATIRQMSFSLLDIKLHSMSAQEIEHLNIEEYEKNLMTRFNFYQNKDSNSPMSFAFSHLFAGGYSSGYYSYKWAEVLDADAFEEFIKVGIFNKEKASSFKENILEKGGSEDPLTLYKRFKGAMPDSSALFKRAGL